MQDKVNASLYVLITPNLREDEGYQEHNKFGKTGSKPDRGED